MFLTGVAALSICAAGQASLPVSFKKAALPVPGLTVGFYAPNIVHIRYAPDGAAPIRSLAVTGRPDGTVPLTTSSQAREVFETQSLQVRLNKSTGELAFYDHAGKLILQERRGRQVGGPWKASGSKRTRLSFVLSPDEAIYGLGQHQDGTMNFRGSIVHLQQENREVAIPFLMSTKGYGVLWDNPSVTDVNVGAGDEETIPADSLIDDDGKPGGLTARYYTGVNFDHLVDTRKDPKVDFDWSKTPPESMPHDFYSVRWTGWIQAKQGGQYAMIASGDDGIRLWVDDQEIVNDWNERPLATHRVALHFEAGSRHRVRFEFYQARFDSIVRLAWRLPTQEQSVTWSSESAKAIDYYFIYGPEFDQVIQGYRRLTGSAPMLPKYALGFWQCKERYKTQEELLGVASEYRRRHIPIDGVIQDWQYWTPHLWGSHEFDEARYPDPNAMVAALHKENVHLLISVWARFDTLCKNAEDFRRVNGLYSESYPYGYKDNVASYYDPFNARARDVYWGQLSRLLFAKGIDGWWLDASEPELSGNWGEYRDYKTAAGQGADVFNAFPLLHTAGVYTHQRAETSQKRVVILTRSAYAGQQRNSAITWSGDIAGTWDVFKNQIPAGLNFCLSGIPYWNTDTGGFFGGDPKDPAYRELFTRWFQFSAFCPMFRVHGTGPGKEMWQFDEPTQKILGDFDRLRYHLMPYVYSNAWEVTNQGSTLMRALPFEFRGDPKTFDIADQYLFGRSLMVCPVTAPRADSRPVYLPEGAGWINFWTGQHLDGGHTVEAYAPIGQMPLYVRSGTILPYGPDVESTAQKVDPLELRIYSGADGKFTLYEDEGDGYSYERGARATISFAWDDRKNRLIIGPCSGQFQGMLKTRTFRIVVVRPRSGVGIGNTARVDKTVTYSGDQKVVAL